MKGFPLQAIPGYSARRSLFEHYVRTRAEEERKEKRAAQRAAIEGFKQLLEEASEVSCHFILPFSFKPRRLDIADWLSFHLLGYWSQDWLSNIQKEMGWWPQVRGFGPQGSGTSVEWKVSLIEEHGTWNRDPYWCFTCDPCAINIDIVWVLSRRSIFV